MTRQFQAGIGLHPVWYPMCNAVVVNVGHAPSQSNANFLRDHKVMTEKYGVTVTSEWANENSLTRLNILNLKLNLKHCNWTFTTCKFPSGQRNTLNIMPIIDRTF